MKLPDFFRGVSIGQPLHCIPALLILSSGVFSQSRPGDARPRIDLPTETVGFDRIVPTLISAFDRVDVVALDDTHQRKQGRFRSEDPPDSRPRVCTESAPHHC